ncbi:hypothetical protein [Fibrobacter sp. UWEL]|uniref:hypothetical protein n=1 Tax=Fibrobacter sp. UWEL TaxID=1896209 RepID=UPI00091818B7|nr:hypothetical protein [Fibrobacter sp. UWEL]SHL12903.1 hypothetical protein SAMN05720468_11433 [Fibrobacter sp. UWEL]
MKIEKKRITAESKWSTATKSGLAALMGLSAAASMVACADSGAPAGPEETPEPEGGVIAPDTEYPSDSIGSSSSNQVVVDIPKSSSSVDMDLLSSASWQDPPLEAGVPIIDYPETTFVEVSSSGEESSSSVEEILSSSSLESSSSSVESSSSEKTDFCDLSPQSPLCPCDSNVHICPDPDDPENMIVSMVTTFESTDIDV